MRFRLESFFEELLDSPPTLVDSGGQEIWYNENSIFVYIRIKRGKSSEICEHTSSEEVYAVIKGSPCFSCDGQPFTIKAGQIIKFHPGQTHYVFNDNREDVIMIVATKQNLNFQSVREKPVH